MRQQTIVAINTPGTLLYNNFKGVYKPGFLETQQHAARFGGIPSTGTE
jgi:hypothetical protein